MQEIEQIDTRTDGPDNSGGILGLFTTVAQTAGQVYGEIAKAKADSKIATANADAARATVATSTLAAQQAATTAQSTWIKGVSNSVVIIGGIVLLGGLALLAFRRK